MTEGRVIGPEHRDRFLIALEDCANVTEACRRVGISRRVVYNWRSEGGDFAQRWDAAVELGTDALEDEAVRRAHEGVDEPVFFKGEKCGTIRRYSDTLLIFMLKARRPDKFKDRSATELTGKDGGPIEAIRRVIVDPRNSDT